MAKRIKTVNKASLQATAHTGGCGECQALEKVELQVNVTSYHRALTVVFTTMENTIRVVLDIVVGIFNIIAICIHHLHGRRVVQTYPNRVRLVLKKIGT